MESEKSIDSLLDRKDIPEEVKEILREYISESNQLQIENESILNQAQEIIQGEQEKFRISNESFLKDCTISIILCSVALFRSKFQ